MRIYKGRRIGNESVVTYQCATEADARGCLPAIPRPGRIYAGGHDWGYGGAGPHQLAWDLLRDATRDETTSARLYRLFAVEVVSRLPYDRWTLTDQTIRSWATANADGPFVE